MSRLEQELRGGDNCQRMTGVGKGKRGKGRGGGKV